jgi:hypothetical protein
LNGEDRIPPGASQPSSPGKDDAQVQTTIPSKGVVDPIRALYRERPSSNRYDAGRSVRGTSQWRVRVPSQQVLVDVRPAVADMNGRAAVQQSLDDQPQVLLRSAVVSLIADLNVMHGQHGYPPPRAGLGDTLNSEPGGRAAALLDTLDRTGR